MGFFNKVLKAAMPKMLGNPIATAVAMISVGVSALKAKKGQKPKKVVKGKKGSKRQKKVKLYPKNKKNKLKLCSEFANLPMALTSEE